MNKKNAARSCLALIALLSIGMDAAYARKTRDNSQEEWNKETARFYTRCDIPNLTCERPYYAERLTKATSRGLWEDLEAIAESIIAYWDEGADDVAEEQFGKTALERVTAIRNDRGEIVAYHIEYSETAAAKIDGVKKWGKIVEGAFIRADLRIYSINNDESGPAPIHFEAAQ